MICSFRLLFALTVGERDATVPDPDACELLPFGTISYERLWDVDERIVDAPELAVRGGDSASGLCCRDGDK